MQTLKRTAWPTALAASLILVILFLTSLSSRSTLAQALDKIKEAKSLRYKMLLTMPDPMDPQKTKTFESIHTVVSPSWMSTEITGQDGISITDYAAGKHLNLFPKSKVAIRSNLQNVPEKLQKLDVLKWLRDVDVKNAKFLGEEILDSRKTKKYQIPKVQDMTVWIDDETHLPVRMEWGETTGRHKIHGNVYTDFQWNVQVDQALLNFEIPEGYQVIDENANFAPPAEADLLAALKRSTERNNGKFPDELSYDNLTEWKTSYEEKTETPDGKGVNTSVIGNVDSRGLDFMDLGGTDWHYAGKNTSLNDKDRPILWYRPKDKETYRIIDATLDVKEVAPADLPKIDAVKIDPAKLTFTPTIQPGQLHLP